MFNSIYISNTYLGLLRAQERRIRTATTETRPVAVVMGCGLSRQAGYDGRYDNGYGGRHRTGYGRRLAERRYDNRDNYFGQSNGLRFGGRTPRGSNRRRRMGAGSAAATGG